MALWLPAALVLFLVSLAAAQDAEALTKEGIEAFSAGDMATAEDRFSRVAALRPDEHNAFFNLALVYLGDPTMLEKAAEMGERAVALGRPLPTAHQLLADVYSRLSRHADVARHLGKLLLPGGHRESQASADVWLSYARALQNAGRVRDALPPLKRALSIDGDHLLALDSACDVFNLLDEPAKALKFCKKAHRLDPGNLRALSRLIYAKDRVADWDGLQPLREALVAQVDAQMGELPIGAVPIPFCAEFGFLAAQCRMLGQAHAQTYLAGQPGHVHGDAGISPGAPLTIGYIHGTMLNDITVSHLVAHFGEHARTHRVICYGMLMQEEAAAAARGGHLAGCTEVVPLGALGTARERAARIAADGCHVLIDLNGWTGIDNGPVLAQRPARAQLHFHGFPAAVGSRALIDHVVVDPFSVDVTQASADYDAKLVLLPHAYLTNAHSTNRREVLDCDAVWATFGDAEAANVTREALGVAEDEFLFASFNRWFKIDEALFAHWMQILRRVPRSRLWLADFSTKDELSTLRQRAYKYGVKLSAIVASPRLDARFEFCAKAQADLFLDSPRLNGHTTVGDMLWAGLPVLTARGTHVQTSRVASSLLAAVGLADELVAPDMDAYVDTAVRLATGDGSELTRLRRRLLDARTSSPLFRSDLFADTFARALEAVAEVDSAGAQPMHIVAA